MVCRTALFSMTLNDPNPDFKVRPFFDAECLQNGYRCGHVTKYENNTSALADISASIIQGSAIGPASYVVHASDLVSITAGNSLCKYADDMYVIIPASNHLSRSAQLDNIQTWANHNNLHLNRAKCV